MFKWQKDLLCIVIQIGRNSIETCFVRVDQNLIWWVRPNGETGAVEIWNDRA